MFFISIIRRLGSTRITTKERALSHPYIIYKIEEHYQTTLQLRKKVFKPKRSHHGEGRVITRENKRDLLYMKFENNFPLQHFISIS